MKVPADIKAALEACPFPYSFRFGGKHVKLYVAGVMVGTFPGNGKNKHFDGPGHIAIVKRIRALAKGAIHGA